MPLPDSIRYWGPPDAWREPLPKQWAALLCPSRETLFGGALGGGKTDLVLMASTLHADSPHSHAAVFRSQYGELIEKGAIMDRAREWWEGRPGVQFNQNRRRFTFPSGSTVEFHFTGRADYHRRFQGAEWSLIAFDEAGNIEPEKMAFISTRARVSAPDAPSPRILYTANPGGVAYEWLKERFVDHPSPVAAFIPSRLEDNPYLDADYEDRMRSVLDPITWAQLRWGDWSIRPSGGFYPVEQVEMLDEAPDCVRLVRAWDTAHTEGGGDYTVGVLMGLTSQGRYVVLDMIRGRWGPDGVLEQMQRAAAVDGAGVSIRIDIPKGYTGAIHIASLRRDSFPHRDFQGVPLTGEKLVRAQASAAAMGYGRIGMVRAPWTHALLSELRAFPEEQEHDDQVDAFALAFNSLAAPAIATAVV